MKSETIKERLIRVETQREQDVETNALEHKNILDAVTVVQGQASRTNSLLINHLAHTDRWLWVLASGLVLAIIPYAVYAIVEIIKHVWLAKTISG
jgi:hypothetical protein